MLKVDLYKFPNLIIIFLFTFLYVANFEIRTSNGLVNKIDKAKDPRMHVNFFSLSP